MFQYEPMLRDAPSDFFSRDNGFANLTDSPATGHLGAPSRTDSTAVIISTRGRPTIVKALVEQLADQSKPPEHVFVIASKPDDITGLDSDQRTLTVQVGRTGSSLQRNDGLALAGSRFSYIAFFDDDFVPSRFWLERMQRRLRVAAGCRRIDRRRAGRRHDNRRHPARRRPGHGRCPRCRP